MTEWIKCSDRLPENGVEVLVMRKGKHLGVWYYWEETGTWVLEDDEDVTEASVSLKKDLWMPIPPLPLAPPKKEA